MVFCWTGMLPLAIALVILVPSILVAFDITPIPLSNVTYHTCLLKKEKKKVKKKVERKKCELVFFIIYSKIRKK